MLRRPPSRARAPRRLTVGCSSVLVLGLVGAGCGGRPLARPPVPAPRSAAAVAPAPPDGSATPTASPSPSASASPSVTQPPAAPPAGPPSPSPPARAGQAETVTVGPVTAADLGASWHPGCPVGPAQLRQLGVGFWGFDGQPHIGHLVVATSVVDAVRGIFGRLWAARVPLRRMDPVAAFHGSDPDSMAADNTSGFNCRLAVAPGPPSYSEHSYGEAIDVNPVENPYLEGGTVMPPAGRDYLDRGRVRPGMAVPGGPLVAAFAAAGWAWGGRWSGADYQHFSATGR